jgi:hypothetical protein
MISDNILVGFHAIQKYLGPRDVMVIFIRSERDLEVGERRFGLPENFPETYHTVGKI